MGANNEYASFGNDAFSMNKGNNTYYRGSDLLSKKIDSYNSWIKILYTIHRITLVVLCIIVFIMLVYKIINKN